MAPPEIQPQINADDSESSSSKPIATIIIFIAMDSEAIPLINRFQLTDSFDSVYPKGVPWVWYHGVYKNLHLNIVKPGKDPKLVQPQVIINAGTAGGFKVRGSWEWGKNKGIIFQEPLVEVELAKGAAIGDAFLVSEVAFHDRRNPVPGAAVAYVADLLKVPVIFLKAVTDIVDGEKPTSEEFLQNLTAVTANLDATIAKLIDFIAGKCISEL